MIEKIKTLTGNYFSVIEDYNGRVTIFNPMQSITFKDRNEMWELLDKLMEVLPKLEGADLRNKSIDYNLMREG